MKRGKLEDKEAGEVRKEDKEVRTHGAFRKRDKRYT